MSAAAWVDEVNAWCDRIAVLVTGGIDRATADTKPSVGGLAYVNSLQDLRLHVVTQLEPQIVSLLELSADSGVMKFSRDRVVALRLT